MFAGAMWKRIQLFAVAVPGIVKMNSAGAGTVLGHEEITSTVCCSSTYWAFGNELHCLL